MTQHKQSHRTKWHHITWNDIATNHSSSPHVTSQPATLLHLTPQATSWHQNRSHHHHGTAEGSFTAKKWFGHRAGRSPCAHSIGKFCLCYIVLFPFETSAPGSPGYYWYSPHTHPNMKSVFILWTLIYPISPSMVTLWSTQIEEAIESTSHINSLKLTASSPWK